MSLQEPFELGVKFFISWDAIVCNLIPRRFKFGKDMHAHGRQIPIGRLNSGRGHMGFIRITVVLNGQSPSTCRAEAAGGEVHDLHCADRAVEYEGASVNARPCHHWRAGYPLTYVAVARV